MKKLFFIFFTVLNSNFSSHEIEDSKFVNSVHGVEYEIIGEIPDAKIAKKGTGISTTATFVNKYSFAPSMITIEKNYDYENQSAELAAIVDSEAPEYHFAMYDIVARPWNYKKRMSRKSKRLIGHPA